MWPGARITVLGKRHNRELLAGCPFVDEFYEFNADPFSLRRSPEVKELQAWLNGAGFDAAIILLGDQFAHLLARAGIPVRVGVKGAPLERCLTHTYEIGSPREWGTRERLNSLRIFGKEIGKSEPELWVDAEAAVSAGGKLGELGLADGERYAVLHPFGSTERQWWNLGEAGALAEFLSNKRGLSTVLVGGPETVSAAARIGGVIDTTGKLTIRELVAVIANAETVITTDSGPFHIAGALRRPTIGLFRARRPEHRNAYSSARVVLGRDDSCDATCRWDMCASNPCRQMRNISLGDVERAAEESGG